MLDDKLAATDWEATQDELIQQITRESYLQWLCENSPSKKDEKTVGKFGFFFVSLIRGFPLMIAFVDQWNKFIGDNVE